jgi:hypothetical protein
MDILLEFHAIIININNERLKLTIFRQKINAPDEVLIYQYSLCIYFIINKQKDQVHSFGNM